MDDVRPDQENALRFGAFGRDLRVTLSSESFANAVHIDVLDAPDKLRLSDHYFDLLPGEKRTTMIYDGAKLVPLKASALCLNCFREKSDAVHLTF